MKVFSQISTFGSCAGALDHGPHDFLAGGVAQGVDDAVVAVAPFAPQGQRARLLIEVRAPVDQLAGSAPGPRGRPSRRPPRSHSAPPAVERVGDVIFEAVLGIEHAGDAPLGVVAVRLPQAALGDDQHRLSAGIDGQRRPQPGQPAADDQHVGEAVRHPLGMERHEIARDAIEHAGVAE